MKRNMMRHKRLSSLFLLLLIFCESSLNFVTESPNRI
jgi:hypothetical protein